MTSKTPLSILVADDSDTDRQILETIVAREGHRVVSARDGREAVEVFEREQPDIVLLDAIMPNLDGFGAAREIKARAGEALVPIIFLTSLTDTPSLVQCLDAGGDDFLSKPYNRVILQAKIKAFNRMREMHATMLDQRDQIARHHEHVMREQAVAKQVFDNIAHSGCLSDERVHYYLSSLAVFNGDVLVAARRPSGSMMVLLGDFTGHGLPAAVGALPLASTFYGMVHKGFDLTDILREINGKLKAILPVGIFCCAAMADIDFRYQRLRIWNGGLPACYIHSGQGEEPRAIASTHLPLGVLANRDFRDDIQTLALNWGERLYMWSDGIHEARNAQGEMYGEERLRQVFREVCEPSETFDAILESVHRFVGRQERDDDLTLIEVQMQEPEPMTQQLAPSRPAVMGGAEPERHPESVLSEWSMSLEILPSSLRLFDPMPLLLNLLIEVPGLRQHSGSLYTILSELYANALEHGLLRLDSRLKASPEGFARYYEQRRERLARLDSGTIRFELSHQSEDQGGRLTIRVRDSGPGFEHKPDSAKQSNDSGFWGRGLALVENLCDSVHYLGQGNDVEAVFSWHTGH